MSTANLILPRYQQLRELSRRLNNGFGKQIRKDVLDEGARALGLLHRGTLVFDSENEMGVLMDYCIHDVRRNGRNIVEAHMEAHPVEEGSDEYRFLQGMKAARFVVAQVEEVTRGIGVSLFDLLRNERVFLADIGLGSSALPGMVIPARIVDCGDFCISTGAPLPAALPPDRSFIDTFKSIDMEAVSPAEIPALHAAIIKAFLHNAEAPSRPPRPSLPSRLQPVAAGARVGRNELCPCGSGRKFKHCCAARH